MKIVFTVILLLLYVAVWGMQKGKGVWADYYLSPAPPANVLKVACGNASQMAGFALFVKVAIFTGGPLRGVDRMSYADNLALNFDVMTNLYPDFIDPYHYCQSFLAPISPKYAGLANGILDRGIESHPDIDYLPFFKAFNYYYYMNEPIKAANLFHELSKRPNASPMFGHLAGLLMARGGNLLAGQTMLRALYENEQDKYVKERYGRELEYFAKALNVQAALDRYRKEHGRDAASLDQLIPRYINALPMFDEGFSLVWEPPTLRLEHP